MSKQESPQTSSTEVSVVVRAKIRDFFEDRLSMGLEIADVLASDLMREAGLLDRLIDCNRTWPITPLQDSHSLAPTAERIDDLAAFPVFTHDRCQDEIARLKAQVYADDETTWKQMAEHYERRLAKYVNREFPSNGSEHRLRFRACRINDQAFVELFEGKRALAVVWKLKQDDKEKWQALYDEACKEAARLNSALNQESPQTSPNDERKTNDNLNTDLGSLGAGHSRRNSGHLSSGDRRDIPVVDTGLQDQLLSRESPPNVSEREMSKNEILKKLQDIRDSVEWYKDKGTEDEQQHFRLVELPHYLEVLHEEIETHLALQLSPTDVSGMSAEVGEIRKGKPRVFEIDEDGE